MWKELSPTTALLCPDSIVLSTQMYLLAVDFRQVQRSRLQRSNFSNWQQENLMKSKLINTTSDEH